MNYTCKMDNELNVLEEKLSRFIQMHMQLKAENVELGRQLEASREECRMLSEKIDQTKAQLEDLIEKIPGEL